MVWEGKTRDGMGEGGEAICITASPPKEGGIQERELQERINERVLDVGKTSQSVPTLEWLWMTKKQMFAVAHLVLA